jgi:hypothetical protein
MVTVLNCGEAQLLLNTGIKPSEDWCQLTLRIQQQSIDLGADTRSIVVQRLLRALTNPLGTKATGSIQGIEVHWVMTLAEKHSTIYVSQTEQGLTPSRCLFFQDSEGTLLGRLDLTDKVLNAWICQLITGPSL